MPGFPVDLPGGGELGGDFELVTEEVADAFAGSPLRNPDEPPPPSPTSLSEDETDEDGEGEEEESSRKDLPVWNRKRKRGSFKKAQATARSPRKLAKAF